MSAIRKLLATTPYPRPDTFFRPFTRSPSPSSPSPAVTERPSQLPSLHVSKPPPVTLPPSPKVSIEPRSISQPRSDPKSFCPLERLTLQPVGTSDHYLDRCFCYLCKCGLHVCPGDLRKRANSPSGQHSVKSVYQEEYRKRAQRPVRSITLHSQASLPVPKRMDLKTTQQMDFQNPGVAVVPKRMQMPVKATVKQVTRSSYQRDFPNWKPGETVLFKSIELPYRGDIVGFTTKTTYQDEFLAEKAAEHFLAKPNAKRADPIAVLSDFYGSTSHKSEFKKPSKAFDLGESKSPKSNIRNQSDWFLIPQVKSMTTTYKEEFNTKEQQPRVPFKRKAKSTASLEMIREDNN